MQTVTQIVSEKVTIILEIKYLVENEKDELIKHSICLNWQKISKFAGQPTI